MILIEKLFFDIVDNIEDILFHLSFQVFGFDVELGENFLHIRISFFLNFRLILAGFSFLYHLVIEFLAEQQICKLLAFL